MTKYLLPTGHYWSWEEKYTWTLWFSTSEFGRKLKNKEYDAGGKANSTKESQKQKFTNEDIIRLDLQRGVGINVNPETNTILYVNHFSVNEKLINVAEK